MIGATIRRATTSLAFPLNWLNRPTVRSTSRMVPKDLPHGTEQEGLIQELLNHLLSLPNLSLGPKRL